MSSSPFSTALLIMLSENGPWNMPGNSVRISILISPRRPSYGFASVPHFRLSSEPPPLQAVEIPAASHLPELSVHCQPEASVLASHSYHAGQYVNPAITMSTLPTRRASNAVSGASMLTFVAAALTTGSQWLQSYITLPGSPYDQGKYSTSQPAPMSRIISMVRSIVHGSTSSVSLPWTRAGMLPDRKQPRTARHAWRARRP